MISRTRIISTGGYISASCWRIARGGVLLCAVTTVTICARGILCGSVVVGRGTGTVAADAATIAAAAATVAAATTTIASASAAIASAAIASAAIAATTISVRRRRMRWRVSIRSCGVTVGVLRRGMGRVIAGSVCRMHVTGVIAAVGMARLIGVAAV